MKKAILAAGISMILSASLIGCQAKTEVSSNTQAPSANAAASLAPAASAPGANAQNGAAPGGNAPGGNGNYMPGGAGEGMGGPSQLDTSSIKTKYLNVSYAGQSDTQKLDIYLPNEGNGPFPVIVAIHGGGFLMGSRTGGDLKAMLEGVNRGYAVVCVEYRLSSEAPFPAAVNDVKAAIRFIRSNAAKYNLNPDKIATWGDSAGGNLTSIAGTTGGTNDLYDSSLGYANVSDK